MSEQILEPGAQSGVKTPEEVHTETLADPATPAIQAEVLEETGPQPSKSVPIALGSGVVVQVPMQTQWRSSAQYYITSGQFDSWAESVLSNEDLAAWDEWMDTDPLMGEVSAFFEAVGKAVGEAAGLNRASRRQLQRTQRR